MALGAVNYPQDTPKPSKLERAMKFFDMATSLASLGMKGAEVFGKSKNVTAIGKVSSGPEWIKT